MKGLIASLVLLFLTGCIHQRARDVRMGPESFKTATVEREARPLFLQAEKFFANRQYEQAKNSYQSVRARYPKGRAAMLATYRLGSIHYYREDYASAAKEFNQILVRYPRSELVFDSTYNLAACEYQQGQFDKASRTLSRFRTGDIHAQGPRRAELVFHLQAQIYEALGNSAGAIVAYSEEALLPLDEERRVIIFNAIETQLAKATDPQGLERLASQITEVTTRGKIQGRIALLTRQKISEPPTVKYASNSDGYRIGVLLPLSGRSAAYGKKALDGILLAAGAFQQSEDRNVDLIIEDTAGSPAIAEQAVETLANEHVIAIVGPLNWKESVAAGERAQALGIPNLSLSAKEGVSEKGAYLFQNAITPKVQLETLVKHCMQNRNFRRFAILAPNDSFGKDMASQFWEYVESLGGSIVAYESYPPEEKDYQRYIQNMVGLSNPRFRQFESRQLAQYIQDTKSKTGREPKSRLPPIVDFDAIFVPDSPKNVGQIAASLAYFDVSGVPLLGTVEWNSDQLYKRGGRYVEGALFPGALNQATRNSRQREFIRYFGEAYGSAPDLLATQAFEAAEILLASLNKGSGTSRNDLVSEMANLKEFETPLGSLTFDETRIARRQMPVYSLTIGGSVIEQ